MKALVIASLLFFGLRAMSAEIGEDQKSPCPYADQGARVAKEKISVETETVKDDQGSKATSK